jgi:nucleoside 2-deoxyribosyltransferase
MIKVYLAGAIEKSPDGGRSIRENVKAVLSDLPVKLIDPCDFDINSQYKSLSEAKRYDDDWEELAKTVLCQDLRAVADCDLLLAILNQHTGFGTSTEIAFAHYCGKPVVAYFADDVLKDEDLHIWVQAVIKPNAIRGNPEQLKEAVKIYAETQDFWNSLPTTKE